jgi:cation diffusion facilitator family transporter
MSAEGGTKAVVAALLANSGIAVTKFIAFLLTGFSSMLAESIHSLADAGNQGLLLLGGKRSRREATAEHPFGFGRERYVYAFIVAIVLFSVGGCFAIYEANHKFHELQAGEGGDLVGGWRQFAPLVVLSIAIVLEGSSFRTAIIEGNKVRGRHGWWAFIRRAKQPELPVILLEDFAALIGLVVALTSVSLSLITGSAYFDVLGSAVIGVLLIVVAIILAIEVKSLLVGESATPESIARIRSALAATDGVSGIIHLKTLHIAPEALLVAAKISVEAGATGQRIATAIDAAERAIRAAEPMAEQIYLEPDIYRDAYTSPRNR